MYVYNMENVVIFVFTCKKYEESRGKRIERSWGNKENVVFITDNRNSCLKNHIYLGPYREFSIHPESMIKMFKEFLENYSNNDWLMIIDDDSYLCIDKLKKYLEFQDKDDCLMIGDYLNWVSNPKYNYDLTYDHWIGGGPGIVFTKKCILTLLKLSNEYKGPITNHDHWLHLLFLSSDKKSIKRIHCCGFHQSIKHISEEELNNKSKNLLISIHLQHNMDLLDKFHKLFEDNST
tara:strand:+ start:46 stop:747 length:702 start_codon:yes stop_codon:yes gene_type:complete